MLKISMKKFAITLCIFMQILLSSPLSAQEKMMYHPTFTNFVNNEFLGALLGDLKNSPSLQGSEDLDTYLQGSWGHHLLATDFEATITAAYGANVMAQLRSRIDLFLDGEINATMKMNPNYLLSELLFVGSQYASLKNFIHYRAVEKLKDRGVDVYIPVSSPSRFAEGTIDPFLILGAGIALPDEGNLPVNINDVDGQEIYSVSHQTYFSIIDAYEEKINDLMADGSITARGPGIFINLGPAMKGREYLPNGGSHYVPYTTVEGVSGHFDRFLEPFMGKVDVISVDDYLTYNTTFPGLKDALSAYPRNTQSPHPYKLNVVLGNSYDADMRNGVYKMTASYEAAGQLNPNSYGYWTMTEVSAGMRLLSGEYPLAADSSNPGPGEYRNYFGKIFNSSDVTVPGYWDVIKNLGSFNYDLYLTDVSLDNSSPKVGDTVKIRYTVRNNGSAVSPSTNVKFRIIGDTQAMNIYQNIGNIDPNMSVTRTFSWKVDMDGALQINIKALDVRENWSLGEFPNRASVYLNVASNVLPPDLVVNTINYSPLNPNAGETVEVSALVENRGDGPTPVNQAVKVTFRLDGQTYPVVMGPSELGVGQTAWFTTSFSNIRAGNHTIEAIVDAGREITESNELNNSSFASFVANTSLPELRVSQLWTTPSTINEGDVVQFKATVVNDGSTATPVGTPVVVSFSLNGVVHSQNMLGSYDNPISLSPGASYNISGSMTWNAIAGNPTLSATVDPANQIEEGNELNNQREMVLTVVGTPQPDLKITSLVFEPANFTEGTVVTFKATIVNEGTAATPSGVDVGVGFTIDGAGQGWFICTDEKGVRKTLAPGESYTATSHLTWVATRGTHIFNAIADDVNRIEESSETNNTLSRTKTIVRDF